MTDQFLSNFSSNLSVVVIGASGGIGSGFVHHLIAQNNVARIYAFSRSDAVFDSDKVISGHIDLTDEGSIEKAANTVDGHIDIVIVATGLLHANDITPEKSMRDLNLQQFHDVFAVNAFAPALIAKYFCKRLPRDRRSVFAALSARVGSISDNRLGGWYAYRAAKTALNMLLKNTAIEIARKYKDASIIGLHPGTVATDLSEPFQSKVPDGKLFTPEYSSACLLKVINDADAAQSGKIFAWDGEEIPA
ncbi:MAG: SDR family NAD(P)-dependent oxidoreductase [Bdellovibrionales bacterium]